jgi:hypothetical protein
VNDVSFSCWFFSSWLKNQDDYSAWGNVSTFAKFIRQEQARRQTHKLLNVQALQLTLQNQTPITAFVFNILLMA